LTAERVESSVPIKEGDLAGMPLAAVAYSSGAEFLESLRLRHRKYESLQAALQGLEKGEADAVVNSVGALRHMVAAHFAKTLRVQSALLAQAYMAVALPAQSPLKKPIDRALIKITATPEWRALEETYFGR
jgi:polar amino acid transport system substrate-binding protein